jgi:hypothetical protein
VKDATLIKVSAPSLERLFAPSNESAGLRAAAVIWTACHANPVVKTAP